MTAKALSALLIVGVGMIATPAYALAPGTHIGGVVCRSSTATQPPEFAGNFLLNCDGADGHDKTAIAVNPTDPRNVIATSTFYGIGLLGKKTIQIAEAHVTTDAGATWTTVQLPFGEYNGMDDTSVTFDQHGEAFVASLALKASGGRRGSTAVVEPDVVAWRSTDGGLSWSRPVHVAPASGVFFFAPPGGFSPGSFQALPKITADTSPTSPFEGALYVTWLRVGEPGFDPWRVFFSRSTDQGKTWSHPMEISGSSASLCPLGAVNRCDENGPPQDGPPQPVVAPDGTVYVSFANHQLDPGRQPDVLIVRSTDGGRTWSDPIAGSGVVQSADPASGLTGCGFDPGTVDSLAISAAAVNPGQMYLVYEENGRPASQPTDLNIKAITSTDGGTTWSAPVIVNSSPSDQFLPWASVGADGKLRVGYQDRDRSGPPGESCVYGYSLSVATDLGATSFSPPQPLDSAVSIGSDNVGEYAQIATAPDGRVWADWSDERIVTSASGTTAPQPNVVAATTGP